MLTTPTEDAPTDNTDKRRPTMTNPEGNELGAPEADAQEADEDKWRDAARVASAREWQASEADLIDQAITVPQDDAEFDR
jgi:hypothetical protein